ncbi:MAG: SHOCT domain-containing protein [Actinomycetota bacterium]
MMMWPNMMGFFGGGGLIWMIFFFIFIIAIIIAIILLIVWLVKKASYNSGGSPRPQTKNALELLKERYARGEITKDEFETIKKDIG